LQNFDFNLDGLLGRFDRHERVPDGYFGGRQVTCGALGVCLGGPAGIDGVYQA